MSRRVFRRVRLSWEGRELVGECEAFLADHLVAHYETTHSFVPGWVWALPLCHADADALAEMAKGGTGQWVPGRWVGPWPAAVGYLARELLEAHESSGLDIAYLQHEAIVPLEAQLRVNRLGLVPPGGFARRAVKALEEITARHSRHR